MVSELSVGTLLYTKDGRSIGNGIIVKAVADPELGLLYKVRTDFGDVVSFTLPEIYAKFTFGPIVNPSKQLVEQIRLLRGYLFDEMTDLYLKQIALSFGVDILDLS